MTISRIVLLSLMFNVIVGCTSTTKPIGKHHHGKNIHHVEKID